MRAALLSVALLVAPAAAMAQEPRPWCDAGPLNAAERAVCDTPELSRLDARLAEVYGRLRSADSGQDTWLRGERDGCGADVTCLRAAYVDRIRVLRLRRDFGLGVDGS